MRHNDARFLSGASFPAFFGALALGQFDACQNQQVVRDDIAPDIAPESAPATPGTAGQAKAPFQSGNIGLDPGAKVLQALVDPMAFGHVEHPKAASLGEDGILDLMLFGKRQIVLRNSGDIILIYCLALTTKECQSSLHGSHRTRRGRRHRPSRHPTGQPQTYDLLHR